MPAEVTCGAATSVRSLAAPPGMSKWLSREDAHHICYPHHNRRACVCQCSSSLFNDDSKAYQLQSTPKNRAPLITTFQFCY